MLTNSKICVGIDWGRERHQVCVLDPQASVLASRSFQHTPAQLSARPQWLVTTSKQEPTGIEVALEVTQGPLVQALQQHGFTVLSINPKQVDRFRDRLSPAGAKDDARDAELSLTHT